MQVQQRGLIFDARARARPESVAFFTSLCVLRSGTILSGFQLGSAKHAADATIRLCRSTNSGESWSEVAWRFATEQDGIPGSLAAAELVEPVPGRLLLFTTWFDRSDPQRPLFDPVTEGILRSRQLVAESRDEGETWGEWRQLATPGLTGCATTGPVLSWPDGSIAYAFESFKEFDDPAPAQHGAWLLISRDGGSTFLPPWCVARDPRQRLYFWDQRLCPTEKSGEFIGLFWTHDRSQQRDMNVHLLRRSCTDGSSGAPPLPTNLPGQIAAPLIVEDRWLAFVVDRDPPGTLTLWQSWDEGQTWPAETSVVIHQHGDSRSGTSYKENIEFAQYWEDMGKWSFGHPAIRRLDAERILLAYYAGTPDRMSIHWARVGLG